MAHSAEPENIRPFVLKQETERKKENTNVYNNFHRNLIIYRSIHSVLDRPYFKIKKQLCFVKSNPAFSYWSLKYFC